MVNTWWCAWVEAGTRCGDSWRSTTLWGCCSSPLWSRRSWPFRKGPPAWEDTTATTQPHPLRLTWTPSPPSTTSSPPRPPLPPPPRRLHLPQARPASRRLWPLRVRRVGPTPPPRPALPRCPGNVLPQHPRRTSRGHRRPPGNPPSCPCPSPPKVPPLCPPRLWETPNSLPARRITERRSFAELWLRPLLHHLPLQIQAPPPNWSSNRRPAAPPLIPGAPSARSRLLSAPNLPAPAPPPLLPLCLAPSLLQRGPPPLKKAGPQQAPASALASHSAAQAPQPHASV